LKKRDEESSQRRKNLDGLMKYRGMRLGEKGIDIARHISQRHDILCDFFKMIGVDEGIANKDSEGMEHNLNPETLKKLEEFIKSVKKNGK
jgi:Mn-dependent DtxR family transcriptional regulator